MLFRRALRARKRNTPVRSGRVDCDEGRYEEIGPRTRGHGVDARYQLVPFRCVQLPVATEACSPHIRPCALKTLIQPNAYVQRTAVSTNPQNQSLAKKSQ
jgi:hypothetical protein